MRLCALRRAARAVFVLSLGLSPDVSLAAQRAEPVAVPGSGGFIHGVVTTQTTIPLGGAMVSLFDGRAELAHLVENTG
jgi:hypothetical protein